MNHNYNMEKGISTTVTLRDIADATGYSINTVSRALADKSNVADETKEKIKAAAKDMGYIFNASASFLRSGVSRVISVIIGDISNPHFSVMVKQIQTILQKNGYTTVVFNTEENLEIEKQAIITSLSQNVAGIIICPAPGAEENISFLKSHNMPFVLIGRRFISLDTSYVICNDEESGYIATRYLLEHGHRNILFLNGPRGISSSVERLFGYRRALEEAHIPYHRNLVRTVSIIDGKSIKKLESIFQENIGFTAILAFSDLLAWQAICQLHKLGKSVPVSCSVVGFDNVQYSYPMQLTSVSSAKITMAKKASELLLSKLKYPSDKENHIILETKIVEGDTVSNIG